MLRGDAGLLPVTVAKMVLRTGGWCPGHCADASIIFPPPSSFQRLILLKLGQYNNVDPNRLITYVGDSSVRSLKELLFGDPTLKIAIHSIDFHCRVLVYLSPILT